MRLPITILVLILCFSSCKEQAEKKFESEKEKTELKVEPTKKVDLTKIPDSLELVAVKNLTGDFNGDNKTDFASIVKNKINQKTGVLIIHNSVNQEKFVFGAGKEIDNMTDLNWIEIFKIIPKGETVAPELVDEETGDLLGPDESQNFKLIGNGIYMSVTETHGGGIIFWNGKEYQWYHIE
jgi:phosphopantothenoylcysteine synthetase/decarboxylase